MLAKLNGRSNLKKLEIFHDNHLSIIVPDKLASAFTSLNELTLGEIPPEDDRYFCLSVFQKLTTETYDGIFYNIYKNSQLEVLNLPGNDLSGVNPDLFGSAISKAEFSTLIGRGPTRLGSHWSRGSWYCWRQQSYVIKNQLWHPKGLWNEMTRLVISCSSLVLYDIVILDLSSPV